jgi:DNA-directed RNA polymerase subunit RPC12/RpoP
MCEVHAHCPNCGQPNLDADEAGCRLTSDVVNGQRFWREYRCSRCDARVTVEGSAYVMRASA